MARGTVAGTELRNAHERGATLGATLLEGATLAVGGTCEREHSTRRSRRRSSQTARLKTAPMRRRRRSLRPPSPPLSAARRLSVRRAGARCWRAVACHWTPVATARQRRRRLCNDTCSRWRKRHLRRRRTRRSGERACDALRAAGPQPQARVGARCARCAGPAASGRRRLSLLRRQFHHDEHQRDALQYQKLAFDVRGAHGDDKGRPKPLMKQRWGSGGGGGGGCRRGGGGVGLRRRNASLVRPWTLRGSQASAVGSPPARPPPLFDERRSTARQRVAPLNDARPTWPFRRLPSKTNELRGTRATILHA